MSGLPLSGLRVLDLTHAAAGPYATMFMADMGAEVIKVERPPHGDGARTMGSPMPGFPPKNSEYYLSLNRNKRGIALDLSRPSGKKVARDLAATADVVVQNFRPGVVERLGLGFEDLRELSAGLIYCSISAFGDIGPWARRPANDIIMQSVSGLMGITGEVDGGPVRIGAPVSDYSTGLFALSGVLAALYVREDHPEGQHVKVSMLEASLNIQCNYIPSVAGLGARIPRLGRGHAQIVPYQAFRCADGEYVMVGAFNRGFWRNFCEMLRREDWLEDERFATNSARLRNRTELEAEIEAIFVTRPREEWLQLLEEADVPAGPVLELHETVRLDQVSVNGSIVLIQEDDHMAHVAHSPIRVEQWPEREPTMAPELGRDTADVLRDVLHLRREEIAGLSADGAFGDRAIKETEGRVA